MREWAVQTLRMEASRCTEEGLHELKHRHVLRSTLASQANEVLDQRTGLRQKTDIRLMDLIVSRLTAVKRFR
jgi:hypothetical protein